MALGKWVKRRRHQMANWSLYRSTHIASCFLEVSRVLLWSGDNFFNEMIIIGLAALDGTGLLTSLKRKKATIQVTEQAAADTKQGKKYGYFVRNAFP